MKSPSSFKVVGVDEVQGSVILEWDNGIVLNHRIPPESDPDAENWTEQQFRDHFWTEAPEVPEVPQFLLDEYVAEVAEKNKGNK